jgi:hypothetical protein
VKAGGTPRARSPFRRIGPGRKAREIKERVTIVDAEPAALEDKSEGE